MKLLKRIWRQIFEGRKEPRFSVYGEFPGKFVNQEGAAFSVLPIDISARGIGLLIDPSPTCGSRIQLELSDKRFLKFRVIHVQSPIKSSVKNLEKLRRCGLEIIDHQDVDLIEILTSTKQLTIQE